VNDARVPIEASYDQRFRDRILDAEAWNDTAIQLLRAAHELEPKVLEFWARPGFPHPWSDSWRGWADEFVAIYFMLSAFAIENFLKARIITANLDQFQADVDSYHRLPAALKTHDLSALAIQAGKPGLASGYADILARLTRSATWYGRYPAPTTPQGLDPFTESPDGEPISLTHYTSTDLEEIRRVVSEVRPPRSC
jgi:hypothetical protein